MSDLIRIDNSAALEELGALGLIPAHVVEQAKSTFQTYLHGGARPWDWRRNVQQPPGLRELSVTCSTDRYPLEEANAERFGIALWRHVTVSVRGQLQARLDEQRRLGRPREPGERSSVPLPDWYELAHLVYEHAEDLGLDPARGTWQYLPGLDDDKLNIAEALHLRQPK